MADSRKHKKMITIEDLEKAISSIVAQFGDLRQNANDRELLECSKCGLAEDIASDGRLTTIESVNGPFTDTGLRFQRIDPTHFRCPRCYCVVVVEGYKDDG